MGLQADETSVFLHKKCQIQLEKACVNEVYTEKENFLVNFKFM